ncbi:Heat shock factor protein [Pseudolycoriella hygida]|uniref:Heat shock factor protein n=1 Tax=Pseudolycoriella hygida TaxID=35572 RepID=A0A9Q0NH09_9DIPT|nr:Heat shock factor protein [Pseudolycoriella hygida]
MHTFSESAAGVPAFLAKLWRLVEDPDTNNLIYWQSDGRSFIIQNQAQFARELLPQNYKHNNMASFIRQLNMYGFHKISSIDNGGLKFDKDEMEFSHPCFQRENPFLLEHIKRKIATTKQAPEDKATIKPEIVSKVMSEVKTVRGRQDTLDSRFSAMKQENEALWREIAILRQKHMKQQQIVNKLIQFLVTMVQPSRGSAGINAMNGVKRRFQLMINDVPESTKKRKSSEDGGPVIRELTEDLLDDCNYEYDIPIDSPNILSPAALSARDDDVDELSSPVNFKIERNASSLSHPEGTVDGDENDGTTSFEPDGQVSYIIDNLPDDYDWINSGNVTDKSKKQTQTKPVQEYVISYVDPQTKSNKEAKISTKPVIASKVQSPRTSLLTTQQLTKKRPQLVLKVNKPVRSDGKIVPIVAPGKVLIAKKPTTATSGKMPAENIRKASSKSYTNQRDFDNSVMPNDIFETADETVSPMLNTSTNVASGSSNSSIPDQYSNKVVPTSSKHLALAKYNNNKEDNEDIQLKTPEDVNKHLDNIQTDLDSLKEYLQADTDYSLDANALFGNPSGSPSTINRVQLSPSVDSELFLKIFGDLDTPFGLPMNSDFPMEKREDGGTSGSELINYQPYNSLDLSEIMDSESALAHVGSQQNENADEDSLLNAPELNTPRVDKRNISFNTK